MDKLKCSQCDGSGEIEYLMMGEIHFKDCPDCDGNGTREPSVLHPLFQDICDGFFNRRSSEKKEGDHGKA